MNKIKKNVASSSVNRDGSRSDNSPVPITTRSTTSKSLANESEVLVVDDNNSAGVAIDEDRLLNKLSDLLDRKLDKKLKLWEDRLMSLFDDRIQAMDMEVKELKSKVVNLEQKIVIMHHHHDDMLRIQRQTDAIINGIPYVSGENTTNIVQNIAAHCNIEISSLVDTFRMRSRQKRQHTSIMVRFPTALEKKAFIREFYKQGKIKLSDVNKLGFAVSGRIFVSESLSPQNHHIFREALLLRKHGKLRKVYTRDGFIYIVRNDGGKVKVTCVDNLHEYNASVLHGAGSSGV